MRKLIIMARVIRLIAVQEKPSYNPWSMRIISVKDTITRSHRMVQAQLISDKAVYS